MAFGFFGHNKNRFRQIHNSTENYVPIADIDNINEQNRKHRDLETICKELEKICKHIEVMKSSQKGPRPHSKGYATYTNFLPRISKRKSLCCPDEYISNFNKKKLSTPKKLNDISISKLKLPVIDNKQQTVRHQSIHNSIRQSNNDVMTQYTRRTRNAPDKRYTLAIQNRIPLKHDTVFNGIKSRSPSLKSIHNSTPERADHKTSNIISNLKGTTSTVSLQETMATLTLDNRHDLGSNDHARHHNKRRQQWIRSDQVKNWRKSPNSKLTKKNSCGTSASSGQKSDVISGNSDDSTHTASSSSEYREQVVEEPMDLEMRETFNKCMKWMETLPSKFSGMHIYVQPSETELS